MLESLKGSRKIWVTASEVRIGRTDYNRAGGA